MLLFLKNTQKCVICIQFKQISRKNKVESNGAKKTNDKNERLAHRPKMGLLICIQKARSQCFTVLFNSIRH